MHRRVFPAPDIARARRRRGLLAIAALGLAYAVIMQPTGWAQTSHYALVRALAHGTPIERRAAEVERHHSPRPIHVLRHERLVEVVFVTNRFERFVRRIAVRRQIERDRIAGAQRYASCCHGREVVETWEPPVS